MKTLIMLNSKKKTTVFNSIDFNFKFWIQFKFNYVTFNSNFVMRIHSILNHWNGSWFFYKIHSPFSSIHHQSWCTSTWSPSCIISNNTTYVIYYYVKLFLLNKNWKNQILWKKMKNQLWILFFINKENLESSKIINYFI
jgi:hypothetical protein